MRAKHSPMMTSGIQWQTSYVHRSRILAPLLACTIAVLIHLLIGLALRYEPAPQVNHSRSQDPRLTVRLIPPTPAAKPTASTAPAHRRPPPGRNAARTLPSRALPETRIAPRPKPQPAPPRPAQDIDWRADLNALAAPSAPFAGNRLGTEEAASSATAGVRPKHTVEGTLAREMAKAARSDCRNAYANMGLLAVPMLAVDAVRRTGCKW